MDRSVSMAMRDRDRAHEEAETVLHDSVREDVTDHTYTIESAPAVMASDVPPVTARDIPRPTHVPVWAPYEDDGSEWRDILLFVSLALGSLALALSIAAAFAVLLILIGKA